MEEARRLGSPAVPLHWRVFYGFLTREGPRSVEADASQWADVDLERGAITLDPSKTDDLRAWVLDPGVVRALRKGGGGGRGRASASVMAASEVTEEVPEKERLHEAR